MYGRTRRRITRCALALGFLAAACSSGDGTIESSARDQAELAGAPTTVPQLSSPASATIIRQSRRYGVPEPLGPLATAFGIPPTMIPPGAHTTDVLGIEMTVQFEGWWQLQFEGLGTVQLTRTDTPIGVQSPTLLFERPVGLPDPLDVADGNLLPGEYSVSPNDLEQWLADVQQIEVVDTGDAQAGDRSGRWYDVQLSGPGRKLDDCAPGPCVHTWWSGGTATAVAREAELLRLYNFADPQGPMFVVAAADPDEFDTWVAEVEELLSNVSFGPSAPHPVSSGVSISRERGHAAGESWRFAVFPGVVIESTERQISRQQPGSLGFEPWGPNAGYAESSIVRPLQSADGAPLVTIDDVIAELELADLERLPNEDIFGTTAAVFTGPVTEAIFRRAELRPGDDPGFVEWPNAFNVHVWAFKSPIGPLLIAAESDSTLNLSVGIENAETLIESMSFDCPDGACDSGTP